MKESVNVFRAKKSQTKKFTKTKHTGCSFCGRTNCQATTTLLVSYYTYDVLLFAKANIFENFSNGIYLFFFLWCSFLFFFLFKRHVDKNYCKKLLKQLNTCMYFVFVKKMLGLLQTKNVLFENIKEKVRYILCGNNLHT